MSEWIKFTFKSADPYYSNVHIKFDGVKEDYDGSERQIGADKGTNEFWVQTSAEPGDHSIQFDITKNDDVAEEWSDRFANVELAKISIWDVEFDNTLGNLNSNVEVYTLVNAEYQALIDSGDVIVGEIVNADLCPDNQLQFQTYNKRDWGVGSILGSGSIKFNYSAPFNDWFAAGPGEGNDVDFTV